MREWMGRETVRGKGSLANCMICGHKPNIHEKGHDDTTDYFSVCCAYCWNRRMHDRDAVGVQLDVCASTIYEAIKTWNRINNAYENGYRRAVADINGKIRESFARQVQEAFLYGEGKKKADYDFYLDYKGQFKKGGQDD